jgi:two-component sensor histidine kinase
MGLIHTELYRAERFDQMDMGRHMRHLAQHLAEVHAGEDRNIHLTVAASSVRLTLAQAVPSGLILNELITNAYQHAFQGRREGAIHVAIEELPDRMVALTVRDDGVGMPDDIDQAKTLGLQLVRGLSDQLEGTIEIVRGNGTEVAVRFELAPRPAESRAR